MRTPNRDTLTRGVEPLLRAVSRRVVEHLSPWLDAAPSPAPPSPPAPERVVDATAWTLPDRSVRDMLPRIADWLREHHTGESLRDLVRALFGDDGTVQTRLLASTSEEALAGFVSADTAPLPRPHDRADYFGDQHVSYWLNGLSDHLYLRALLREHGRDPDAPYRFLDFACSSGRVLRHVLAHSPQVEVHGTDLSANAVRWMNTHLPARGVYFQNAVVPSLPLPDGSIDLVYGGSIFTHLDEFEESWLLELRRVLAPGGLAFLTVHTERTWAGLRDPQDPIRQHLTKHPYRCLDCDVAPVPAAWLERDMPSDRVVFRYAPSPFHNLHTFHHTTSLRERWGRFFEVRAIVERAHGARQDGVVLVRRS